VEPVVSEPSIILCLYINVLYMFCRYARLRILTQAIHLPLLMEVSRSDRRGQMYLRYTGPGSTRSCMYTISTVFLM